MADKLIALAEKCERHAQYHFSIAADWTFNTSIDLHNIDKGLACLERAAALRAAAQNKPEGSQ